MADEYTEKVSTYVVEELHPALVKLEKRVSNLEGINKNLQQKLDNLYKIVNSHDIVITALLKELNLEMVQPTSFTLRKTDVNKA